MSKTDMLEELRNSIRSAGFTEGTEEYEICYCAMNFLGTRYERTEELASNTIDCSTLTSQSHWEGALIGIPFIADSQRRAASGQSIESVEHAKPADVFVRYRSIDDAPDGKFNHVGLYLGPDYSGRGWLIESRGGQGVILTRIEDFPAEGGIKRFVLREAHVFNSHEAKSAQQLAKQIPKMGRLGARQYSRTSTARYFHKGVDIYVDPGTKVLAPIGGFLRTYICQLECAKGVEIVSSEVPGLIVRLLNVAVSAVFEQRPLAGVRIGEVDSMVGSEIQYVDGFSSGKSHLHLEVQFSSPTLAGVQGIRADSADCYFFSPLYLIKAGVLSIPLLAK